MNLLEALERVSKNIAAPPSGHYHRNVIVKTIPNAPCWYVDRHIWHMGEPAWEEHPTMPSWHWGFYMGQCNMTHFEYCPRYGKVAYVFMLSEGTLFPLTDQYATWPSLYSIGRSIPFSKQMRVAVHKNISYLLQDTCSTLY